MKIIILVPSRYNDGFLDQHLMVLTMDASIPVLIAIIEASAKTAGIDVAVEYYQESLQAGEAYLERLVRNDPKDTIFFLSVRTYQLSRGIDVARRLRRYGFSVVIGGAGVRLTDVHTYRYLQKEGIIPAVGEGEEMIRTIMEDFAKGTLKPAYYQPGFVNLRQAPFPNIIRPSLRYAIAYLPVALTLGCSYNCKFCAATLLGGKSTKGDRCRSFDGFLDWIWSACHQGVFKFLLCDNNFLEIENVGELLEKMIGLNERVRRRFGRNLDFFVQVDTVKPGKNGMAELMGRAGIGTAFMGFESPNNEVLKRMGKKQNDPGKYRKVVLLLQQNGIRVNGGIIVGHPGQRPESFAPDVEAFLSEVPVDVATAFMSTPFPGTPFHREAIRERNIGSWDPNNYDLTHGVYGEIYYAGASPEEVAQGYREALVAASSLRRFGFGIRPNDVVNSAFAFLALAGGNNYMGGGIPRPDFWRRVARPQDSFRGFALTLEDLDKRIPFLESLVQ